MILADPAVLLDGSSSPSVAVPAGGRAAAHRTARTPMDRPIVMAVAHRDADGAIRTAVSGVASGRCSWIPGRLAELDPPADFRGSSSYRAHLAEVLVSRALATVGRGDRA